MKKMLPIFILSFFVLPFNCWSEDPQGEREYFLYKTSDEAKSVELLVTAAKKRFPPACYELSQLIQFQDVDFTPFGKDKDSARILLLTEASKTIPAAKFHLALKLNAENSDQKLARKLFKEASTDNFAPAWQDYAMMCSKGEGGARDLREAYFYISLACEIAAPNSPNGIEVWNMRNSIAKELPQKTVIDLIRKLDNWFAENGKPDLTILGTGPMEEYQKEFDEKRRLDKSHRERLGIKTQYTDPFAH